MSVIHGDCLDVMRGMDTASVDAVITDPPYNVGFAYAGDASGDNKADYEAWCREWFAELRRICSGPIAISCGHSNLAMWSRIDPPTWTLAWWKPAAMGRCVVGFNNWEPILLYGKPRGAKGADVVRAPIKPSENLRGHPCPKPLEWALGQMRLLTKPGDMVLDPFAGSGTTGVAALLEGRRFVGIEREAEYVEIARARIAAVPPTLEGVA